MSRPLRSALVVICSLVLAFGTNESLRAQEETSTTSSSLITAEVATTTTLIIPTTIPDDFLTLYPEWSDDNMDYLDPQEPSVTPLTTTGTFALQGLGVVFLLCVLGIGLRRGGQRLGRRQ